MSNSPNIVIADSHNFATEVLGKSKQMPVLVDFWADWCAPCKMLMPVLSKLADEYQGKFTLAKVNTEEQHELATRFNIRSIPALKLFRHGKVVEEMVGVQSEETLRELIDRHRVREADKFRSQAMTAYHQGDTEKALQWLNQARESDPTYYAIHHDLAKILIDAQRLEEAEQLLQSLPAKEQTAPEFRTLFTSLKFSAIAAQAPSVEELEHILATDPKNLLARYQLSAQLVLMADYEAAMQQLLELMRQDRHFQKDAAHKAILDIFNLLGNQGELVSRYRGKMSSLLY